MSDKLRRKLTELIHDGGYAADVGVKIVYNENWLRTMSGDDARKLETVTLALSRGDIAEAAKYGPVLELTPVTAK